MVVTGCAVVTRAVAGVIGEAVAGGFAITTGVRAPAWAVDAAFMGATGEVEEETTGVWADDGVVSC